MRSSVALIALLVATAASQPISSTTETINVSDVATITDATSLAANVTDVVNLDEKTTEAARNGSAIVIELPNSLPVRNPELQSDVVPEVEDQRSSGRKNSSDPKKPENDKNESLPAWMVIVGLLVAGFIAGCVSGIVCVACCCKSAKGEGLIVASAEKEPMLAKYNKLPFKNDLEKRLEDRRLSSQADLSQKKVNVPMSPAYPSPSPAPTSASDESRAKSKKATKEKRKDTVTESIKRSSS